MLTTRRTLAIALGTLIWTAAGTVAAQEIDSRYYYRLTTEWQGKGKALDIVNDGANNTPMLAATADVSGQYWCFTQERGGLWRLTTMWQGPGKSLDIVNEGDASHVVMLRPTGNFSGQLWRVTPAKPGKYRLTTQFQGEGKSLDIVNDGTSNSRVHLAATGDYSGQFWRLKRTDKLVEGR